MKRRRDLEYLRQVAEELNGVAPAVEEDDEGKFVRLSGREYVLAVLRKADEDGAEQVDDRAPEEQT